MKETPILMTPENAQKCFDGRKVQTRRLNGLDVVNEHPGKWRFEGVNVHGAYLFYDKRDISELVTDEDQQNCIQTIKCHYGAVGDRVWVLETTALWREGWDRTGHVVYRGGMVDREGNDFSQPDLMGLSKWTPSIHMKRIYCRSVLELTEIRVQRLQEISEEDAKAEGMIRSLNYGKAGIYRNATEAFKGLWESINGAGSWAANPWVWALSFKKVPS